MSRSAVLGIAILGILAIAGSLAWYTSSRTPSPGTPETITIGTAPVELAGLIYIAEDQGFFPANGLKVTVKNHDSALSAVTGMEAGESDIALSTEYPIAAEMLRSENISVIGCVDKYQTTYLVGMKNRGIRNSTDIAGKKIGVARGSIGEFYLGRFLALRGMNLTDVTRVDLKPAQLVGALTDGSIDAAIIWNIDPETVEAGFGGNAVIWPAQGGQPTFGIMTGREEWITGHPEAIARFLRSLDEAEAYSASHPDEAERIVQQRLNVTDAYIGTMWPKHRLSLSLDQSLVVAMDDEGRWMIANNLTTGTTPPDFVDHLSTKGLEEVKPGSVYLIR